MKLWQLKAREGRKKINPYSNLHSLKIFTRQGKIRNLYHSHSTLRPKMMSLTEGNLQIQLILCLFEYIGLFEYIVALNFACFILL